MNARRKSAHDPGPPKDYGLYPAKLAAFLRGESTRLEPKRRFVVVECRGCGLKLEADTPPPELNVHGNRFRELVGKLRDRVAAHAWKSHGLLWRRDSGMVSLHDEW